MTPQGELTVLSRSNQIMVIAVVMLFATVASGDTPDIDSPPLRSNLCGPQCIRYVLQSYGMNESVVTIADQLNVSEHVDGVSLLAIRDFLIARGVPTIGMRFTGTKPDWPYPVILHVLSEQDKRGHFIVLCPKRDGDQFVWDAGRQYTSEGALERATGFALLTAPPGSESCFPSESDSRRATFAFWFNVFVLPFSAFSVVSQLRYLVAKR